jgi:Tfp pilus assembly protein PilE
MARRNKIGYGPQAHYEPETLASGHPSRPRARVSLGAYLVSLIVVALVIFILVLVQYLPGYRSNYRLSKIINNSNVEMTVTIPMSETENRKENPFTKEQKDKAASLLKGMGAKSATVVIKPQSP